MDASNKALLPLKNSCGMYMVLNDKQRVKCLYHMASDTVWNMYKNISLDKWACINDKYRASVIQEQWNCGNLIIDSAA